MGQQSSPSMESSGLSAGYQPELVSTGDEVLQYWDFDTGTGEIIGILLLVYAILLGLAFYAMAYMHKLKR